MTRGDKSSEKRACYHAFVASCLIACFSLYFQADLTATAGLIVAVCAPLMWYAGARTTYKCFKGEQDEITHK